MRIWQRLWRLLPLAIVMLALAGCGREELSALNPQGEVAEMQFSLMALSLYIMIGVFLVVAVLYVVVLLRFRARPGDKDVPKQVEGNHTLEFIWTVIPIILLIVLAVPTVKQTFLLDNMATEAEASENTILIEVTAHQFWWEFKYPDHGGVKTAQEVVIPTGADIQFDLTSVDVLHAFWVPALAGKQDNSVQGSNRLWLTADKPGTYEGRCTELCGASHALMNFKLKAVEPAEFENWIVSMQAPEYQNVDAAGQEVFNKNCIACHAVGPDGGTAGANAGPNLTNFGDRDFLAGYIQKKDVDVNAQLQRWIRTPHKVKEGALMPGFANLAQEDMDALINYLNNLKVKQ